MRWGDLVLNYVRVLVWPAVTVAMLLVFRRQVRGLLSGLSERIKDLKSLKFPGGGLDFAVLDAKKTIDAIEADTEASQDDQETAKREPPIREVAGAAEVEQPTPPVRVPRRGAGFLVDGALLPLFESFPPLQPHASILAEWQALNSVIEELYKNLYPDGRQTGRLAQAQRVVARLMRYDAIASDDPYSVFLAIRQLANIRNRVAHREENVTTLEAYEYADSVRRMIRILNDAYAKYRDSINAEAASSEGSKNE